MRKRESAANQKKNIRKKTKHKQQKYFIKTNCFLVEESKREREREGDRSRNEIYTTHTHTFVINRKVIQQNVNKKDHKRE